MAHYSPGVRDDNTLHADAEGRSQSAPVGRRQKRGMKYANDASRQQRPVSAQERKSQLRMRLR